MFDAEVIPFDSVRVKANRRSTAASPDALGPSCRTFANAAPWQRPNPATCALGTSSRQPRLQHRLAVAAVKSASLQSLDASAQDTLWTGQHPWTSGPSSTGTPSCSGRSLSGSCVCSCRNRSTRWRLSSRRRLIRKWRCLSVSATWRTSIGISSSGGTWTAAAEPRTWTGSGSRRRLHAPRFRALYRLWTKEGNAHVHATVSRILDDALSRRSGRVPEPGADAVLPASPPLGWLGVTLGWPLEGGPTRFEELGPQEFKEIGA